MNTGKIISSSLIAGIVALLITGFVFAQEKKDEVKTTSEIKEVQGKVTAVGKDYIAVAYQTDLEKGVEYEIFLPVGNEVRLVHKRKISDIHLGDSVKVAYEEESKEYDPEKVDKNRKAKTITFLKPAEISPEPPVEAPDDAGLSLKGLKGE